MNRQEFEEKLERGIAQVRAGQGIVKTMEELERMAEETRIAQLQLPDPADADPHPRLLLEGRGIHAGEGFTALCIYRAELATCTGKTCHLAGEFPPPRRRGLPVQKRDHIL